MVTCSVCKRRPAAYKRAYSGHALCPLCLERMLERAVRRALAGVLERGATVLVPVYRFDPWGSLALARLLARVEARHRGRVVVAAPKEYEGAAAEFEVLAVEAPKPRRDTLLHCMRLERAWALEAARRVGASAVVDSVNRDMLSMAGLEALLEGAPEGLSDALPAMAWVEPPVVHGFARVEAEAITAYAFLRGLTRAEPACSAPAAAKRVYLRVAPGRPELAFSSARVLEWLSSKAPNREPCRFCGGYGGPVCRFCREARLGGSS